MIKAILFDMVGVLVFKKGDYNPQTADEVNAEKIESLFNHVDDHKLIKDIKEQLGLTDNEIDRAAEIMPGRFDRFNDLWELLPELKKKYKLAVINNGNAIAKKHWDSRFGFREFDMFINSALCGIKKPDPGIYLLACKELGVKPAECIFMDDMLENVKTADTLGMKTIWWNKEEDKKELLGRFMTITELRNSSL